MLIDEQLIRINNLSLSKKTSNIYDYTCFIQESYSELIIGRDGSGKTSLAIAQGVSYCIKRNITLIYINADAKSGNQSARFSELFKDLIDKKKCLAYHLNYYDWKDENKGREKTSFLDFIFLVALNQKQKKEKTYLIIDNWAKIISGYESHQKKVGAVIDDLEENITKNNLFTTVLLAHTGKNEQLGARGMSSLRSIFGQELLIQVDMNQNRIVSITKDSEANFSNKPLSYYTKIVGITNLEFKVYEESLINEDNIMYHKEKVLEKIVIGVISKLKINGYSYVKYNFLKHIVFMLGSNSDLSISDADYLSASFCSRNMTPILEKYNIKLEFLKDYGTESYINVNSYKLDLKPIDKDIDLSKATNDDLIEETIISNNREISIKELKNDIERILEKELSTQEIRDKIYLKKDVKEMTNYSKRYARDNIKKALNELIKEERIIKETQGRKTIYKRISR